jgi:GNAT superfamily N-acetyltransferase
VSIAPFHPGQRDAVIALIVPIQTEEFGVVISAEDQPDLQQIPRVYQRGRGQFWVATLGGELVGTVGLLDFGSGGALRKMFVRRDRRGSGLGQALLDTAVGHARAAGLPGLWLGTVEAMTAAHRFYERNGFTRVAPGQLPPDYPRAAVDTRFYLQMFE